MKKHFILWLLLSYASHNGVLMAQESDVLKRCNTSRFAFYHGKKMKEFIQLMNLARLDGVLLYDYVTAQVPSLKDDLVLLRFRDGIYSCKGCAPLKPSLGLHLSAWSHAVMSGISGYSGHKAFEARTGLFLNVSNTFGENCSYGPNSSIGILMGLLYSPGHRANILDPDYLRVGVSKKFHRVYRRNTVSVFSGKKLIDKI
jgi:hypothetical protein